MNPRLLMAKETSVLGVTLFTSDDNDFNVMYNHLKALIQLKCIKPALAHLYPLEEAGKAQNDVINNTGATGRLTLVVSKND